MTREERRQEAREAFWAGARSGSFHYAIAYVAILLPGTIAIRVGLGWMFLWSAMVVLATGVLLAYKMKLYPFTEKRNHW